MITPLARSTATQFARRLIEWFDDNARDLPWRNTRDPYAIWISEVMLQQTQVRTVVPYWERWMQRFPDVRTLATARPTAVLKAWEGLGYYARARNLQRAAQMILREQRGEFPTTYSAILALPGLGRYAAGAIGSIAFNQPTPVLDGNVIRVLTRLFAIRGNPKWQRTNSRLWAIATSLVEAASRIKRERTCGALNQALMELGALICTPKLPDCPRCPLRSSCRALRKGSVASFPNLAPRVVPVRKSVCAFVISEGNRFLVRQRHEGQPNAQLWEFPNHERLGVDNAVEETAREALSFAPADLQPFLRIRHSITRYRITLEAFRGAGSVSALAKSPKHRWGTLPELDRLPFASAHRKILAALMAERLGA